MACVPLYGLCGGVCVCGLRRLVSLVNVRSAVYTFTVCLLVCVVIHACVVRAGRPMTGIWNRAVTGRCAVVL